MSDLICTQYIYAYEYITPILKFSLNLSTNAGLGRRMILSLHLLQYLWSKLSFSKKLNHKKHSEKIVLGQKRWWRREGRRERRVGKREERGGEGERREERGGKGGSVKSPRRKRKWL